MYQFIHVETYARVASKKTKPTNNKKLSSAAVSSGVVEPKGMDAFTKADGSKGKKGRSTMSDVVSEALREPTHCAHVANPMPPTFLYGDANTLLNLDKEIEQKCAAEKKLTGREPRKDMHVLLAGVASYPRALQVEDPAGYDRWEKATVKWLREKYGDKLRCVLQHDDEAHPHIHFFVCDRERVNAKELHDGHAAVASWPGIKTISKEATRVFNDSMRDFQSDYYAKVGHAAGLQRDGPKRLRLDQPTYKAREREARERVALTLEAEKATAAVLNDAAIESKKAVQLRREVERAQQAAMVAFGDTEFDRQELLHARAGMAEMREELDEQRQGLQRDRAAVDAEWTNAREARAAAARLESDASRKLSALEKQADAMERARAAAEQAKAEAVLAAVARDREADALRTKKAEAVAIGKKFQGQLAGLGAIEDMRALVRKPELVAMVEFIDQNPKAREVLALLKAEPFLAEVFVQSAQPHEAVGMETPTWHSPQASDAAQFLASLDGPKHKSHDTDFSL